MLGEFFCERHAIDSFAALVKFSHSRKNALVF